jgi:carbon storage regulator
MDGMLVINRRPDDQIVIGPGITITIAGIRRDQVQIGIDAPRSVRIMRQELIMADTASAKRLPPSTR